MPVMSQPRHLAASVRQRLLNLAIAQKEDFNLVLTRYGIERLLYRLERSAAGERFILKGAMLFILWSDSPHRATKDVDLLCRGDNSIAEIEAIFRETVIAEKFEAMVLLGIGNTRMKDFYDLWYLSQHFTFEGDLLGRAIAATFERRRTPIPTDTPLALTNEFADDETKQRQWVAFVRKGKLTGDGLVLNQIRSILHDFLMPPTIAIGAGVEFNRVWSSALGWQIRPPAKVLR
jgi:hypothetical protein